MQNRDKGYIYLPKKVKDSIQAVFEGSKGKIQSMISMVKVINGHYKKGIKHEKL